MLVLSFYNINIREISKNPQQNKYTKYSIILIDISHMLCYIYFVVGFVPSPFWEQQILSALHISLSLYSVSSISLPCGRNITGFLFLRDSLSPHTARMTPACTFAGDSTVFTDDVVLAFFIAQNAVGVWKYY